MELRNNNASYEGAENGICSVRIQAKGSRLAQSIFVVPIHYLPFQKTFYLYKFPRILKRSAINITAGLIKTEHP